MRKTTIYKICLVCKKKFFGPYWYMKGRKFCSNRCNNKHNRGMNNPAKREYVRRKISLSKKNAWKNPNSNYHSEERRKKIYTDERSRKLSIANSRRYASIHTYRNFGWKYLSHVCFVCGNKKDEWLTVHHIDGNRYNNDLKNLKILCYSCHILLHYFSRRITSDKISHFKRLLSKLRKGTQK